MSVYIKHTNAFSCQDLPRENIDIWFTKKVFNIHEKYTETDKFAALFSG